MAPGKRWMDFNYDAYGQDGPDGEDWWSGFGHKDIQAAQGMGYTNQQIAILAQRAKAQGRNVGPKNQARVDSLMRISDMPWDYGGVGGAEFGLADLNMALGQGADYDKIKGYADYARQYGIGVGSEADSWLNRQETMKREEERWEADRAQAQQLAQQARDNAAANALRISQATADQTAQMEAQYAKARKVTPSAPTSSPLSSSGAGSFRARGLEETRNRRGSGTGQFRATNPYFTATLNTGTGKTATAKSTLNV